MDAKRFDGLARSIASWSSRRRFIGGVAGAAAGGLLGGSQVRAQQGEPADPDVLAAIVQYSQEMNTGLNELRSAIETYRSSQGQGFDPLAFDPRLGQFINDLITLTERAMEAENQAWDTTRLTDYFLTVNMIVGAVSAGGDTDVQLYQNAVRKFQELGGEATPAVPDDCINPERPPTCTASCLDVWVVRETLALSTGDMVLLQEAFKNFIECYIYFNGINVQDGCLSTLLDEACAAQIICGCAGDCR